MWKGWCSASFYVRSVTATDRATKLWNWSQDTYPGWKVQSYSRGAGDQAFPDAKLRLGEILGMGRSAPSRFQNIQQLRCLKHRRDIWVHRDRLRGSKRWIILCTVRTYLAKWFGEARHFSAYLWTGVLSCYV